MVVVEIMAMVLILIFCESVSYAASKRIIVIETMPVPVVIEHSRWFKSNMAALGYTDGKNAEFVMIKAEGSRNRALKLLRKALDAKKTDIVVTFATLASQAAWEVLKDSGTPVLFSVVSDPVGAGLIQKVGDPTGTNITGTVATISRETKIEMVLKILKKKAGAGKIRFGSVYSSYPSSIGDITGLKEIAAKMKNVEFISYELPYRNLPEGLETMLIDYARGIKALEPKVDYWWQTSGPLYEVEDTTHLQMKLSKLPVAYGVTLRSVELGALMTINADFREGGKETARLADLILKGTPPGNIPVIAPKNFNMGLNLKTAMDIGVTIPSDMMSLAGKHIYQ